MPHPPAHRLGTVAGFLLAGGKSSRMGTNKALLRFRGEPLVSRGVRLLQQVCAEVEIVGGVAELAQYGRVVPDEYPEQGPLGGIVSALAQSSAEWNLFLAIDMPSLPVSALQALLAGAGSPAMVTLAQSGEVVQPLCGVYSRQALPLLRAELLKGNRRVRAAVEATGSYRYWQASEQAWFNNLNTPEEFAAAEILADALGT